MNREFDTRPWITLDQGMPENPKIAGLSDAAFRLYIEALCYCSRNQTDGQIPTAVLRKLGTTKAANELEKSGLVEDGVIHDYLKHQRSREEINEAKTSASARGSFGGHRRWHADRGITDPDCSHCRSNDRATADSNA